MFEMRKSYTNALVGCGGSIGGGRPGHNSFSPVYKGVIREVYEVERCIPATNDTRRYWDKRLLSQGRYVAPAVNEGRSEFIGRIATEAARSKYIGKSLPRRHSQNAVLYFNC
jgi:hypothetical protein